MLLHPFSFYILSRLYRISWLSVTVQPKQQLRMDNTNIFSKPSVISQLHRYWHRKIRLLSVGSRHKRCQPHVELNLRFLLRSVECADDEPILVPENLKYWWCGRIDGSVVLYQIATFWKGFVHLTWANANVLEERAFTGDLPIIQHFNLLTPEVWLQF